MTAAQGVDISVVIPVTTAHAEIEPILRGYTAALEQSGHSFEFVFVLDGISGGVEHELKAQIDHYPLKIVRLQGGGLGESIALSAGVNRASGDFIINAPQYLQSEPEDLFKVVQALEKRGLVRRTRSETDRRSNELSLTDEGAAVCRRMRAMSAELHDGWFDGIPEADRAAFFEVMFRLVGRLAERGGELPRGGVDDD